ncbi:hypothetical protein FRC06_000994 [Ceratobasidium sp. 370]|nr:hypothetical protein FRC06_000994 [Ceratobasidium sp. 370]
MARKAKSTEDSVLAILEGKYPRVDSTLIAALLSEIDPSQQHELDDLSSTLSTLSSPSEDVQSLSSALEQSSLTSSGSLFDPLNDSSSSHATTSTSSTTSLASFSTPLGFLQNLFPRLPSSKLQSSLDQYGVDNLDQVVESLLSDDYIRELQEADVGRPTGSPRVSESVIEWTAVTKKSQVDNSPTVRQKSKPKKQATLVIGDVRHRHLAPSRTNSRGTPSVDPWTYVDSLATRLSAILPNVSATVFSSAFHNPTHPTPAAALRSTLGSLGHTNTVDDFALAALLALLDAGPEDIPDASLCLRATASEPNDAYHLVEILREIDERLPVIVHYPSSPVLSTGTRRVPSAPPDSPPIPQVRRPSMVEPRSPLSPSTPLSPASPAKSVWGTVPVKPKARAYSHSAYIPGSSEWTVVAQGGEERSAINEDDMAACLEEAAYWQEKRRTALKQASELYTRQKHEHGREGALYYSQRAQEFATKEKEWKMKAAKATVKARQERVPVANHFPKSPSSVVDRPSRIGSTPASPLQIITGQGRHSKGNIPVIAPAVMKLLEREGWRAHKSQGTVYVTGVINKR